jgi:hypothetical protein
MGRKRHSKAKNLEDLPQDYHRIATNIRRITTDKLVIYWI